MNKFLNMFLLLSISCSMGCNKGGKDNPPSQGPFVIHVRVPAAEKSVVFSLKEGNLTALEDDVFGQRFQVESAAQALELSVKKDGVELDRFAIDKTGNGVWLFAGSSKVFVTPPPVLPQNDKDLVVYFVPGPNQASDPWGLHIWDSNTNTNFTNWQTPLAFETGNDQTWGFAARLGVPPQTGYSAAPAGYTNLPSKMGLIVHNGDNKATEGDIYYEPARQGRIIFLSGGSGKIYCSPDLKPCGWQPEIEGAAAHWVKRDELLWRVDPKASRYLLLSSLDGKLDFNAINDALTGSSFPQLELTRNAAVSALTKTQFPHLASFASFRIDAGDRLNELVKSELMVVALNDKGRAIAATRVQLGGILDEAFAYQGALGLVIGASDQLRLWAPTAQTVSLKLYNKDKKLQDTLPMVEDRGVWSIDIPKAWVAEGLSYRYALRVFHPFTGKVETYEATDPYAVSGTINAEFSQLLDLKDPALKPAGWDAVPLAPITNPTDHVYYEMHIRDFSIRDATVPKEWRGGYKAFTLNDPQGRGLSQGMAHLKGLQASGLTHVQVLPAYDFGSVNEERSEVVNLDSSFAELCKFLPDQGPLCKDPGSATVFDVFSALPKDSSQIATLNAALIDRDSFNWGYDPVHYGMPEGSYVSAEGQATLGEGQARVLEFRSMAQGLAEVGLHLAMDVVYNHTYSSALNTNSVLDKVVPGYYHRLNPISGAVERSSCCENTASERLMMEKLMIDTLKRWHEDYKVDAFRFDLMGLHYKDNMLRIQEALGPDVYLFGEGWQMGELASDARNSLSARQNNMAGTGIGSFNDRFRDAVRGGGPMDCGVQLYQQSPVNGLSLDDNGRGGLLKPKPGANCTDSKTYTDAGDSAKQQLLLVLQDRLRLGLAATLSDYSLTDSKGKKVTGSGMDYFGQAAGYTKEPRETINYIENHDNQTFWDITQMKLPYAVSMADRVRVHSLGLSFNMLGMGVPYFEMGAEFLRSKSLVRDSYNAGDWYNQVDFTLQRSNWNTGLPSADKDGNNLAVIRELYKNVPDAPQKAEMSAAVSAFKELLAMRKDSILLRLPSAADIQNRLDFIAGTEAIPGVIAMRISDEICQLADLDPNYSEIVVVFNMKPVAVSIPYSKKLDLHPVQAQGQDPIVKQALADGISIEVPARTTAVFVSKQLPGVGVCRPELKTLFR